MAKVAEGIRYAERVVAGEIIACEYVRLACQRFLDDLAQGEERGIFFSEPRAQHILNFYKFVPHVKGALAGQPIELMDWHVFILINIFGFVIPLVNEETGETVLRNDGSGRPVMVRRFRTADVEVARKNAKSTLCSGVGLYMAGADGEGGAEVYSAATTRDQARIVFEDAKNMVKKAKATLGRLFEFNKLAIYQEQTASKFEPLSSDANNLDGLNIHCAIVDELHAHKTRDVWDVLETATGARLQSLLFGITTAGFNKEGIAADQFGIYSGSDPGNYEAAFFVYNGQVFIRDAMIQDGSITNAKIGSYIRSTNFAAGVRGWNIDKNGDCEFHGKLYADSGNFAFNGTNNTVVINNNGITVNIPGGGRIVVGSW